MSVNRQNNARDWVQLLFGCESDWRILSNRNRRMANWLGDVLRNMCLKMIASSIMRIFEGDAFRLWMLKISWGSWEQWACIDCSKQFHNRSSTTLLTTFLAISLSMILNVKIWKMVGLSHDMKDRDLGRGGFSKSEYREDFSLNK